MSIDELMYRSVQNLNIHSQLTTTRAFTWSSGCSKTHLPGQRCQIWCSNTSPWNAPTPRNQFVTKERGGALNVLSIHHYFKAVYFKISLSPPFWCGIKSFNGEEKKKKTNTMPTLGIPGRARILMCPFDQRIKLFLPPFLSLCPFLFLPFFHECSGIEELSLEVWTSKKLWIWFKGSYILKSHTPSF